MIYYDENNIFCDAGCLSTRPRFQALFPLTIAYTGQFLDGRAKKYNKKPNIMFTHNVIYVEPWQSRNGL